MVLEEHASVIGKAAGVVSFFLMLAPSLMCKNIVKKGTTKDIPVGTFIECIARNVMNIQLGVLSSAAPMVVSNSIGFMLNIIYMTIYVLYTKDKGYLKKVLGFFGSVLFACVVYAQLEDPGLVEWRFGTLNAAFNILLLVYHTYRLKVVIQTKSTKGLPLPILVVAFFVSLLWFLYGVALYKPMLMISAGIAFVLCTTSLSMFLIYPSTDEKKVSKKKSR